MQTDEAYLFITYDSRGDTHPKFAFHGCIADASVPEDVPIRQSVEIRALVFWDA